MARNFMNTHNLLAIAFALFVSAPIAGNAKSSFIGREVPPIPPGCSHQESMVLGGTDSFGYERWSCKKQEFVVLQRFKERRGKHAIWEVIDELQIPFNGTKRVALEVPLCTSSNHPNESVLALGQWVKAKDGSLEGTNITQAWRFNLIRGKIEAIQPSSVSCSGDNPD